MASTGKIGPNAKVRVDAKGQHDLGTFGWTVTKEKTPFTQIGDEVADRYTSAPKTVEWTGEVQAKADGSFGIPWDTILDKDQDVPLVFTTAGRTERLISASLDSIDNSYDTEGRVWKKSLSGKAFDHKYE